MNIAVVITTYNRPDMLGAVLAGYLAQTDRQFEVIIADDGSGPETAAVVARYQALAPFPLRHVWQEDTGFRAAAARNRAIAATQADYIIFTDGDCVPPPDFVAGHRRLAAPGKFLSGSRVLLTEAFTRQVLAGGLPIHEWRAGDWWTAWRRKDIARFLPLLRLPLGPLRTRAPARWRGCKTCNLSAFRADLVRVNGFDESYCGWGMEDSDLVIRLLRAGVTHKSARFAAPVFHLWHPEYDRSGLPENQQRLQLLLASPVIQARTGLEQYLAG